MAPRAHGSRIRSEPTGSLVAVGFLASLDPPARSEIERKCTWRRWSRGQQILDREGVSDDVYFIVSGRAHVVDFHDSGQRFVIFDEIGPGGSFGELSAIDGLPRSAYVVAAEETVTGSMPARGFIDLLFAKPEVGMAFLRRLSEMIRQSDSRIMEVSTLTAQHRVYLELLRRAKVGGGRPANTGSIQPSPNHGEMAARVSATRETVSRVLGDLTRQGLLSRDGDTLVITDVGRLISLAHTDRE